MLIKGLQRRSSDRDLSSTSSFSEDDSSIDTSEGTSNTNLQQNVAPSSTTDLSSDTQDDDVFIHQKHDIRLDHDFSSKRSNTSPNLLDIGVNLTKPRLRKGCMGKRNRSSSSLFIEECRKFEASISAMTAQHVSSAPINKHQHTKDVNYDSEHTTSSNIVRKTHLDLKKNGLDDNKRTHITYPQVIKQHFPAKDAREIIQEIEISTKEKLSPIARVHSSDSLTKFKQLRTEEFVMHVSNTEETFIEDDVDSYILFNTKLPQNGRVLPDKLCHNQEDIHSTNNQNLKSEVDNCEDNSKHAKSSSFSFFTSFKSKLKKLFDIHPVDTVPMKKSKDKFPQSLLNQAMANGMEGFAVREFPLSSFPSNSAEEIAKLSPSNESLPNKAGENLQCFNSVNQNEYLYNQDDIKKSVSPKCLKNKPKISNHEPCITVSKIKGSIQGIHSNGYVVNQCLLKGNSNCTTNNTTQCLTNGFHDEKLNFLEDRLKNRFSEGNEDQYSSNSSLNICQNVVLKSTVENQTCTTKSTGTDLCRFYHVFREDELKSLIQEHVPSLRVVNCMYDHANWCILTEKI